MPLQDFDAQMMKNWDIFALCYEIEICPSHKILVWRGVYARMKPFMKWAPALWNKPKKCSCLPHYRIFHHNLPKMNKNTKSSFQPVFGVLSTQMLVKIHNNKHSTETVKNPIIHHQLCVKLVMISAAVVTVPGSNSWWGQHCLLVFIIACSPDGWGSSPAIYHSF